jgi:hypothetical protein
LARGGRNPDVADALRCRRECQRARSVGMNNSRTCLIVPRQQGRGTAQEDAGVMAGVGFNLKNTEVITKGMNYLSCYLSQGKCEIWSKTLFSVGLIGWE